MPSKSKKIALVLQQINSLPTLPAVATRLLHLTMRNDTQADEVVRLIESDPALASKIITIANRASRVTTSLKKAVVLLGFDVVRNAVLSIKVFESFNVKSVQRASVPSADASVAAKPAGGNLATNKKDGQAGQSESIYFDRAGFWKHSLAVACASEMLVRYIDPKADPDEAFICGLLHDIGKIALDTCLPKSFLRVVQLTEKSVGNISDVEEYLLGVDHSVVGKRLAQKWHLPDAIVESIWLHHYGVEMLPDAVKNKSIVQAVHLADILARQQRAGYSGNHSFEFSAEETAAKLGCDAGVIEKVSRKLLVELSKRGELLGLNETEPQELYHQALSQANTELGRLNERLQQQNKRLQQRNKYFELLVQLNHNMQADQSVVDICSLINKLWQKHTGCTRCAVYALSPDEDIIEGAVQQQAYSKPTPFLVDCKDLQLPSPVHGRVAVHNITTEEHANTKPIPGQFANQNSPKANTERQKVLYGCPDYDEMCFSLRTPGKRQQWFFEQVAPEFNQSFCVIMPLCTGQQFVGAILWEAADNTEASQSINNYRNELKELETFSASTALAILQAQKREQQSVLCEQLAHSNSLLSKAQEELLHKRTLAMVGEMACGAAHEINNPLAVVVGRSELLANSESDPKKKKALELIAYNGHEITDIVTEMLKFARPALPRPQACKVRELIDKALKQSATEQKNKEAQIKKQLESQAKTKAKAQKSNQPGRPHIEINIADDLPDVFVDNQQIITALENIIRNALDACQEKPATIQINAQHDEINNEVILELIDNGIGMPPETLRKACDPFFSNKKAGRSRGLGLSYASRYIENNGGYLQIISDVNHGTRVTVRLPELQSESAVFT